MELIKYWSEFNIEDRCYVHSYDLPYHGQLKKYGFADDLIPVPYVGDIRNAKVIIAMINPGLQTGENSEYIMEARLDMKMALMENLNQTFEICEYPFIYLNPSFSYHPGYIYWDSRFKRGITEYAKKHDCSFKEAQKIYAKNIAILQLVPYHSISYKGEVHRFLPSSNKAKEALEFLSKGKLVIVPRKHKEWLGIEKPKAGSVYTEGNVVTYFNRSASFGDKVRQMIIECLS